MRETVLYIGMSLDGYIADCDGGVGWMGGQDPTDESAGSYPEFLHTVDTVMMGRNTYHQIVTELSPEEWVYAGLRSYVSPHQGRSRTPMALSSRTSHPVLWSTG